MLSIRGLRLDRLHSERTDPLVTLKRILRDGVVVEQTLDPDDRTLQSVRVPRTSTDEIVLEILAVDQGPRNTTAISDVAFAAAVD